MLSVRQQLAAQQAALAAMHYGLQLLLRAGLRPWVQLMGMREQKWQAAGQYRGFILLQHSMWALKVEMYRRWVHCEATVATTPN